MSIRGYVKRTQPANWTRTPSGARQLAADADRAAVRLKARKADRVKRQESGLAARLARRKPKSGSSYRKAPVKRETASHRAARAAYLKRRVEWLAEPEQTWCLCCLNRNGHLRRATEVHHKHGRGNQSELLMVEDLWLPVCADCHDWIHRREPEAARRLRLLAPRGQWNKMPL